MHFIKKRPCKAGENAYCEENVPPKRNLGFMKVGSLLVGIIYFQINRFDFSIEFFQKMRSRLTEALTLPGYFFSKWILRYSIDHLIFEPNEYIHFILFFCLSNLNLKAFEIYSKITQPLRRVPFINASLGLVALITLA